MKDYNKTKKQLVQELEELRSENASLKKSTMGTSLPGVEDITEQRRVNDRLQESEEHYRRLFETLNDGIVHLEKSEGKITRANPASEKILGYSNHEIVGHKLQDIGVLQNMDDFRTLMHTLNRDGIVRYDDISVTTKGGQHIRTHICFVDNARFVQCNIRDITCAKQIGREKEIHCPELSDFYENAPCGYHSIDRDGFFVYINAIALSWLGYARDELIGKKKFTDIISARSQKYFQKNFPVFKERGWINDLEFEMIAKDGRIFNVLLNATAVKDHAGNYLMSRSTFIDISERKRLEQRLEFLATTDELTDLWNHRYIIQEVQRELEKAHRYDGYCFSLLMLDIDNFKKINDQHGHDAGDQVLSYTGDVIKNELRQVDVAGRYGGEEFVVTLPQTDTNGAFITAERLRQHFCNNPLSGNGRNIYFTVTIGIAECHQRITSTEEIIKIADNALYEAKNQGRNLCIAASI